MDLAKTLSVRQRLLAGLLLAVFSLQAADASQCCDMDMESATKIMGSEEMPCHGDDGKDHDSECCLSCISMATPSEVSPATTLRCHTTVASAIRFDLVSRPDLPYRPPTHNLS